MSRHCLGWFGTFGLIYKACKLSKVTLDVSTLKKTGVDDGPFIGPVVTLMGHYILAVVVHIH